MKKLLPIFIVVFAVLIALTLWLNYKENNPLSLDLYLQQKLPQTVEMAERKDIIDFGPNFSEARPAELNNVDLFLPHYHDYEYSELKKLFDYSNNCLKAPKSNILGDLQKTFTWIDYTCQKRKLPKDFFRTPPYLSPSGKSFVRLALETGFDFNSYLTPKEVKNFQSLLENILVHQPNFDLNLQQLKGLMSAEDFLAGERFVYIKRKNVVDTPSAKVYVKLESKDWLQILSSQEYKFEQSNSSLCLQKVINGCWTTNKTSSNRFYRWTVFFLDGLLFITFLFFFLVDKKRRKRQKESHRFTLQMLTHELRTPVTTLALQLENIRADFDQLNPKQQVGFLNMTREMDRLKNSMQMSYAYLQTDHINNGKIRIQFERIELNQFLKDFTQREEFGPVELVGRTEQPVYIQAESFWLSTCLTNLVRNAFDHGKPPVQIKLSTIGDYVHIEVQDRGELSLETLKHIGEPFRKSEGSKGLGLGLSIIHQIMHEMNGELRTQRGPTRFLLVFRRSK